MADGTRGTGDGATGESRKATSVARPAFAPLTAVSTGPTPVGGRTPASGVESRGSTSFFSGLTGRIFLASASIVALLLAVSLTVLYVAAVRDADGTLRTGLEATSARVNNLLDAGERDLIDKARIYASNPSFRSVIERPTGSDYLDQAQTMAIEIGASWVQLTDVAGRRLARSDDSTAEHGVDLSASRLVADPLSGKTASGFGVTGGTSLFYAVGVPIIGAGKDPIGVAMAATNITDTLAAQLERETGSDIVFYSLVSTGQMEVVAASPGVKDRSAVKATLEPMVLGALADSTRSASAAEGSESSGSAGMTPMREAKVTGVGYGWSTEPIHAAGGRVVGGVIALRNRDAVLAQFQSARLLILGLGLLALLTAFGVSLLLARQITRPVRALVVATTRATEGDYDAEIPASGTDEIGSLAAAFRQLLGNLREQKAIVEFLQNPAGGRTVSLHAATPTMRTLMEGAGAVLEPGQLLASRYEIKSVLGVGGMGMVYRAVDRELGDTVAVKTLKPDMLKQDPAALERFRSEIRLARRISHRNVVRTHDIGESGGMYYITMELVEGKSLKDLIESRGRLPAAAVLPIAKQLCRALEVAHEAGVIHRDIKPQNMVVEPDGVLKVMDFGIARLAQRTGGHTQAGMIVGTIDYMAPEQLLGKNIDSRADLYAVGVVLYESLTGRLPFVAESSIVLITQILDEMPPTPRAVVGDVPAPLSELVMRTLSKEPDDRPKSAGELLALLDRL